MPNKKEQPTTIYQIKITLNGLNPAIWRKMQVSADVTLFKLHRIIQEAMGWTDSHLHQFVIGDDIYKIRDPYADFGMDESSKNERTTKLRQVIPGDGFRFRYDYDFGDNWKHALVVERILAPDAGAKYPRCLDGARACPPEDVGGIHGYGEFLEALRDLNHPAHEEMSAWIGRKFDPAAFDLIMTNQILRQLFP
ncbi:MAG: plasmid pRiA4b ORF-3 family protein [Candidatus Acidiferrum sp.]